jgi:hypothetical protein
MRKFTLVGITTTMASLFAPAPQQAAPRRLPIPKASAQCPARSSPSYWICFPFCSDREQRGSAVPGTDEAAPVIWHALAENQAADIARLTEVDP